MKMYTHRVENLDGLFVHGLRDIFYTEQRIAKTLPRMISKATNWDLKQALETHLLETSRQIRRLEEVFTLHGADIRGVECPAIDGIIRETDDIIADIGETDVMDAALAAAARTMEHYEIARYGMLTIWAQQLGHIGCAALLQQNLEEEEMTDQKLMLLAQYISDPRMGSA